MSLMGKKSPETDRCEGVKGKARQLMRLVGGFSCGQGKAMRGEKKDGVAFLFCRLLSSLSLIHVFNACSALVATGAV